MIASKKEVRLPALFIANLMLNTGAAFMWPLTTVYMNKTLGESLTTAGAVLLIMSLVMMVGNYVGGILFDRWSPYLTGVTGAGISLVAMVLLIFFHGWPTFAILLVIVGFGDGISLTVGNSFAATITSTSIRNVFNLMYIALNVGVVIGTLLVGYLLGYGVTIVFSVTTICYVLLFVLMLTEFKVDVKGNQSDRKDAGRVPKLNLKVIWWICLMVFAIYTSYSLWESVLSVHMTNLNIQFKDYSLLWTMNGFLIIFGQPLMNKLFASHKLATQIGMGVSIFALSFFGLMFAHQYSDFVIIMIVLTIGEMIGFPGLPAWVDNLAKNGRKGRYQGMYNVAISLGRAVGPLFGGLMIDYFSYQALFLSVGLAMILAMGGVLFSYRQLLEAVT
ncbi:major facilitator superfamily transporter [Secundilactobacillus pentosiphilus]|uniref:Major facilitator superfamily transporter n=1 Tax=Secundilactobacillus pentosiphilus TaxID=1714682 RepID=A0A1Z5IPA4_9LACO|nr:MFS transporter [Secundilactobacillus pentosiphilus]GAX03526.1 major facilitator superfamily transporter [Secundilactobacillus pentosiphilus]